MYLLQALCICKIRSITPDFTGKYGVEFLIFSNK